MLFCRRYFAGASFTQSYISTCVSSCLSVGQKELDFIPSGSSTRSFRKSSQRCPGHHLDDRGADINSGVGILDFGSRLKHQRRSRRDCRGLPQRSTSAPSAAFEISLLGANLKRETARVVHDQRIVSLFFARFRVLTPSLLETRTQSSRNSGRYFETGSSSEILPSSTSIAIVTPQKPLVCEHCM